jgi:uncharacterized protein (DUF2147 family)
MKPMKQLWIPVIFLISLACAQAQSDGVLGLWKNDAGSTIQVSRCKSSVCVWLITVGNDLPARVDSQNPDPTLRTRSLCGLLVGTKFRLADPNHAEDGQMYWPKTGKTHTATLNREGDKLTLHVYVVLKLFGKTETWTRAPDVVPVCRS